MFSYDTRLYLASASPFIRVSAKPQPDTEASLTGRGGEEEATNTSFHRDAYTRKSLGSGRKAERTLGGLAVMPRQLRNNSASRTNNRRLRDKERDRSKDKGHDKPVSFGVSRDSLRRRESGDDGSDNTY